MWSMGAQGLFASLNSAGDAEPRVRFDQSEREDQIARRAAKGSRGGRPRAFDAEAYQQRNVIERCFNRLKQFRGLATRYAKRAATTRPNSPSPLSSSGSDDLQDTP
ncbi:hypothetical protein GCM10017786_32080 [Amycolatopsis deserti]|uniref:Transposase IS4-like domain-containing protein n=1 Tax=Amycolatopsis deserti TaxID=185696 RepID=A0ABQ3J243_9PSEU|nr:hypothetical protein GCM10017786_32080 [Amycolatopsis deserti]